jgi:FkbM family methyltransferase
LNDMTRELRFLLAITRRLPRVKGAGRVARLLRRLFIRKKREPVCANVLGFRMELDPSESVDASLLFAPQLYDYRELDLLRSLIRPGDVFLDAGAHIGTYSLVASALVGSTGRVLAVEASAETYTRLARHRDMNGIRNLDCMRAGLSDRVETLRMARSFYGNQSGNSFLKESPRGESVDCLPLRDLLDASNITQLHGAKFDIEGFEFRVMSAFLRDAPAGLRPRFVIFEHNEALLQKAGGDMRDLLRQAGYTVRPVADQNYLAQLPAR